MAVKDLIASGIGFAPNNLSLVLTRGLGSFSEQSRAAGGATKGCVAHGGAVMGDVFVGGATKGTVAR
jgi:hypothetical protein